MKIVIVDDNQTMRKVLKSLCESQGYEVVADLGDGITLLECVRKTAPDLVCLDYNLPGKNGLELLEDLQKSSPQTDVVMITGSNDPDLNGRAANAGAAGFLRKPFSQAQIIEEFKNIEAARKVCIMASNRLAIPDSQTRIPSKDSCIIVDDSGTVRLLLKGVLESMGMSILASVTNGEEGVSAAKRFRPALVCLDVEMPVMSGLEALPLILEASPQTKVVMVTGNPNKAFVEASIAGGAKGYLLKPIRPVQVEAFVKKLLG